MELLRAVAATLRFPGPEDDPVAFGTPPTVTVTRDSTGAAILTEAPTVEVKDGDDTYYTVQLSGSDLSEVDLLSAVWSDGASSCTTYAEVVGGFACSLQAIRKKYGPGDDKLDDAEIAAAREGATRDIEDACSCAFRPRFRRDVLDGSGGPSLLLSRPLLQRALSVSISGEAIDVEELVADSVGLIVHPSSWPQGTLNVEAAYVHGYTNFPPAELPVRDLAAHRLAPAPTDWNDRATSRTGDDGMTYTLITPGVRGASFPLPSVNAFVEEHRFVSVG